jgi:hypothetical protein
MSAPVFNAEAAGKRLRAMVAEAKEMQAAAEGPVTDTVAGWLAAHYAAAAHEKLDGAEGGQHWEILHAFVHDWALLRRGDQAAARLQLDREHFVWEQANSQCQKEKEFREWVKKPEIREELFPEQEAGLTPETLRKIEKELNLL